MPTSGTFAAACYDDNSAGQLDAALAGPADESDCEIWEITADEWRAALVEAMTEKLSDQIERIGLDQRQAGPCDCLCCEVGDDGAARVWDDGASVSARCAVVWCALRSLPSNCSNELAWDVLRSATEQKRK